MSIKLIATDMDGTFLNSQKDYNRERFADLYAELKKRDIKFVVASGNQSFQLKSFFPDISNELTFAAENGAHVISKEEALFAADMPRQAFERALSILAADHQGEGIICGIKSAYILETAPETFYNYTHQYYHRLARVPDLSAMFDQDTIVKMAFNFPEHLVDEKIEQLTEALQGVLFPVSTGEGDIDILVPGVTKASALADLGNLWDIQPEEMAAFGDGGNDLEMLQFVGHGYAMSNAIPSIKAIADHVIGNNDEDSVLTQIEKILEAND
ncbi:MAG: Cof-type HAD-IIB family hydrolase [Lactococcus raffinolactis]|jgi:Cof subfamily protein (haloacid dehalogenase superfamily)|uniref:Cof-type HAD-IIB family hydrolase n=1 Tax=Pseudolactococcus raffinolactis TaxID=1366 RepID=A0A290PYY1_9LACT|nr:Cof-type HAD-IIB family hydrolase [Lactococcus raffinolactis]ATC61403.1 sugar-phosphatase [Lactococcus raffinolactis]MDN5467524.1 Cof-type HAD-IIB family hydrolase [Lactococcus raffinolactis]MDT2766713.1 Cof-type HAD-IIB family hydrolase [Lactococcus raffinolactis]MDT2789901.1 Cof-type HAD-IIB family hydrolase [Lactococcus raffinolactis]QIW50533.1 Cof-type HAD-IIB family hydrolase [Lactococcus raffinolactis]